MKLLASLSQASGASTETVTRASSQEDDIEFHLERLRIKQEQDAKHHQIPRFYKPKPQPGSVEDFLEAVVRKKQWQQRSNLSSEQIECLKRLVLDNSSGPSKKDAEPKPELEEAARTTEAHFMNKRISYEGFSKVATCFTQLYGTAVRRFFAPSTFLKFERNKEGTISSSAFMEYVKIKDYKLYLWRRASAFDSNHDGYLTEVEVQALLKSLADELHYDMQPELLEHWKVIAPRKVFFFLSKNGLISVMELLTSSMLDEITMYEGASGNAELADNWFAPQKSMAIYEKYRELDVDCDGFLSPIELSKLRSADIDVAVKPSSMTKFFLTRVYEVHVHTVSELTHAPAMNLSGFADFLLAWNLRGELPSIRYFFKVLDLEHSGKLTAPVVAEFTKHVAELWTNELNLWEYDHRDIKDEIFDMVTPKNPNYITLQDLHDCAIGDIICGVLVDAQCHYEYDQKEQLAQQHDDES